MVFGSHAKTRAMYSTPPCPSLAASTAAYRRRSFSDSHPKNRLIFPAISATYTSMPYSLLQNLLRSKDTTAPAIREVILDHILSGPLLVSFLSITLERSLWRRKPMTTPATGHVPESTTAGTLFVAFELSEKTWKLGFTTGHGQKPRERTVTARHQEHVLEEIAHAKRRLGLPDTAPVVSCYEAGREGFWLHRFLQGHGITNHVVDSSSIEVNRRRRRAKSDGLDVRKLLSMLLRYAHGERQVWQVVKVPSVEAEDQRHLHRDLETLKQERASTMTRIEGLLSSQGLRVTSLTKLPEQLEALRLWDGSPMPPGLRRRVMRVYAHYTFLSEQIAAVEVERRDQLQASTDARIDKVRQLMQLKGLGINGAWLLVMEFFGWRALKTRREVGGLAGFTPTPYQSGESAREQGITKSGNRHVR